MRKVNCSLSELIENLSNIESDTNFLINGIITMKELQKLSENAKKIYKINEPLYFLHNNVLLHCIDFSNTTLSNVDRKDLYNILCELPFKMIKISSEMASLLCVKQDQYDVLNPEQITNLFDPKHFAENNFHECGPYAFISGLQKDGFFCWCAEGHLRYNNELLNPENETEALLIEIEHWKKFRTLFDGIPAFVFTYYLNHWQNGLIPEFYYEYPDLIDLPSKIFQNIKTKKDNYYAKIKHIQSFKLECKKSDLKYFVIDNKGDESSVFELKITGKIEPGSIACGFGYIYKWLCNQHFNGSFGLDLRDSQGLDLIRGENYYEENLEFPIFSVRFKYLYLPKETQSLEWHSFINQEQLTEIIYSTEKMHFGEYALSETSISKFIYPEKYSISFDAIPWGKLKEITLPSNFAISEPFYNSPLKKNKFKQWDSLLNLCPNLEKIRIPKSIDGFFLSAQSEFIELIKNTRPEIYIEIF